jgi:hypothetical protein
VGDLNLDGKPDLAVTNNGGSTVSVLFGNGDGTFAPQVAYATGGAPYSAVIADLNGDGMPDLALRVPNLSPSPPNLGESYLGESSPTWESPPQPG